MFGSSHTPKAPNYIPPAPFVSPGQYQPPPDPNATIPQALNPTQIIQQGNKIEGNVNAKGQGQSTIPQWLQINQNPMNPAGMEQYANNWYAQNVAPQLAQTESQLFSNGQGYGSYAGGLQGQAIAQAGMDRQQAGLNYAQQLFGDQLQGRASYYAGGPTLVQQQNNSNIARGENVAGLQLQNSGMLNNYNLGSSGMQNNYDLSASGQQNNFNLSNYQNQLQGYLMGQQLSGQRALGAGTLLGNGIGGLMGLGGGSGALGGGGAPTIGSAQSFDPFNSASLGSSFNGMFGGSLGALPSSTVGDFANAAGGALGGGGFT